MSGAGAPEGERCRMRSKRMVKLAARRRGSEYTLERQKGGGGGQCRTWTAPEAPVSENSMQKKEVKQERELEVWAKKSDII
jgi:hypothetical protein